MFILHGMVQTTTPGQCVLPEASETSGQWHHIAVYTRTYGNKQIHFGPGQAFLLYHNIYWIWRKLHVPGAGYQALNYKATVLLHWTDERIRVGVLHNCISANMTDLHLTFCKHAEIVRGLRVEVIFTQVCDSCFGCACFDAPTRKIPQNNVIYPAGELQLYTWANLFWELQRVLRKYFLSKLLLQ